jgi:branched-subunit amino acid transport protein
MEVSAEFIRMLIGVSLVTLLSRTLPMVFVSKLILPKWAMNVLKHVPVAVMTALVVQSLATDGSDWLPPADNGRLIAFLPTVAVALMTRNLLAAVGTGIVAMMCLNLW